MNLAKKIALFVGILVLAVSVGLGFLAVTFSADAVVAEVESALLSASGTGAREVAIVVDRNLSVLQEVANR